MAYPNCKHTIWICSPSSATAVAAHCHNSGGCLLLYSAGLAVIVTVAAASFVVIQFLSTSISSISVIIRIGTNSNTEFRIWISKLEFRGLFIYDILINRADLIKMTQIQIRTYKHQISEMLAIAAMTLLLIHIADGSMERIVKHGFLSIRILVHLC